MNTEDILAVLFASTEQQLTSHLSSNKQKYIFAAKAAGKQMSHTKIILEDSVLQTLENEKDGT